MNKVTIVTIIGILLCSQAFTQNSKLHRLAPMPTARYGMCSVVYNDEIWVMGGKDRNDSTLNIVECYLPYFDQWKTDVPRLNTKRFDAAAVVYQDKIYVIGGSDEKGISLSTVEYFDPKEDQWKINNKLLVAREALTAVVLADTMYAIGGGYSAADINHLSDVEFWDEKKQQWNISPTWKLYQPRLSMATVVIKDAAYTLGGSYFGPVAFVECYQPHQGTELRQPMPTPRYNFAAVAIKDTVYVIGGATRGIRDVNLIDSIEKYNPTNDQWLSNYAERFSLDVAREGLNALAFMDNICIFGGRNLQGQAVDITEMLYLGPELTTVPFQNNEIATSFQLYQSYPNPFNSQTIISFSLKQKTENNIRLNIFNMKGQIIKSFTWNSLSAGEYNIIWNGNDETNQAVTSGLYLYQLSINKINKSVNKMMLIR